MDARGVAVRFSDDEGESWSEPTVIARCDSSWLAYPMVFEVAPGTLWITTLQSELKVVLHEQDFV